MAEKIKKISKKFFIFGMIAALLISQLVIINKTRAGNMTKESDTMTNSRTGATELSNHEIHFVMPSLINEDDTIVIKLDDTGNAFTLTGLIEDDIDIAEDTDGSPGSCGGILTDEETAGTATATEWGVSINTGTDEITLTAPTTVATYIAANACVVVEIGSNATHDGTGTIRIGNPASEGTYYIDIVATNTAADTGKMAVAILNGIAVSATVSEYLSFASYDPDDSVGFGTWSTGPDERWADNDGTGETSVPAGATNPTQLTVSTNATNGVSITVKSINSNSTAGLYSSGAAAEIAADSSSDIDTDAGSGNLAGFGVYASAASNLTRDEGFDNDTTSDLAVSTSNQVFATASGAVNGATVDVEMNAVIMGSTPIGSYATTVVFVATPTY